jgi:hypothetical protein
METNTNLGFMLLEYDNLVAFEADFEFMMGMGQTPGNVVFDPMDLVFNLIPRLEFLLPRISVHVGTEHKCFHEVDRMDFETVYWNKFFLAASSPHWRLSDFSSRVHSDNGWSYWERISWYFQWGYYMRKFFGIVSPNKLNGMNWNVHDFDIEVRCALVRWKSLVINTHGVTTVGLYRRENGSSVTTRIYWTESIGVELNVLKGTRGGLFFIRYRLDDIPLYEDKGGVKRPIFSRDKLIQFGLKFFT